MKQERRPSSISSTVIILAVICIAHAAASGTSRRGHLHPWNELCRLRAGIANTSERHSRQYCGLAMLGYAPGLEQLFYKEPKRFHSEVLSSTSGAIRFNRLFELGKAKTWYPEYQHHGADFVQAGLVLNNEHLVQSGLRVLHWAVERLERVQNFERVGDDARHSISFFFEATARAALLLHSFDQCPEYVQKHLLPLLRRLSRWARDPIGDSMGGQAKFTHIRLLRAVSFFYMRRLVPASDPDYRNISQSADRYLAYAMAPQWSDGSFPEKNGFDVHYQGFSVMYTSRLLAMLSRSPDQERVREMLEKGMHRLERAVKKDGSLDTLGSVRVNWESARDGKPKTVDYKSVIHGLLFGSYLLENPKYYEVARRVARYKYHLKAKRQLQRYYPPETPWKSCT